MGNFFFLCHQNMVVAFFLLLAFEVGEKRTEKCSLKKNRPVYFGGENAFASQNWNVVVHVGETMAKLLYEVVKKQQQQNN